MLVGVSDLVAIGTALLPGSVALYFTYAGLARIYEAGKMVVVREADVRELPNLDREVDVEGVARPDGEPLTAPLSGADSVLYEYAVEERRRVPDHDDAGGPRETRWVTVDEGHSGEPFRVEDDTGSALVDPAGAELGIRQLDQETTVRVGPGTVPTAVQEFVDGEADVTPDVEEAAGSNARKYHEHRVEPGTELYVEGEPARDPTVSTGGGDVNAVLADTDSSSLLVAASSEKEAIAGMLVGAWLFFVAAAMFATPAYLIARGTF